MANVLAELHQPTAAERRELERRGRQRAGPYQERLRAQIVLAALRGQSETAIETALGCTDDTVRSWLRRWNEAGLEGLADRPRSGRPRHLSAADRQAILDLAMRPPDLRQHGTSTWSVQTLRRALRREPRFRTISHMYVWRLLREAGARWQNSRTWCVSPDPEAEAKKGRYSTPIAALRRM